MATGTSTKGGYDCEFVTAPPKSLECPICLLTVRQPHVISCCGNQFCQPCIGRIQNDNKPCPLCNDGNFTTFFHKGVMREVNSLMVQCSNKEMGCDWEGELGQLEEHLNPGASVGQGKGCGFVIVECRYKCGESFLRNVVQDHELHQCPKRPVNSLSKNLDSICIKLDRVIAENEQLKRENKTQKAEIENLKAQIAVIKNAVATCTSLQTCVTPPVPPFYFTLFNTQHYMKTDYEWRSAPFYSHKGGYKLVVAIYPNGWSTYKGTHLSLLIVICRGEYDDKLIWPFSGKITAEVRNVKTDKWVVNGTIDFKAAQREYRLRPPSDCISGGYWGYPKFLPHAELRASYLKEDRVHFRISRVEFG